MVVTELLDIDLGTREQPWKAKFSILHKRYGVQYISENPTCSTVCLNLECGETACKNLGKRSV